MSPARSPRVAKTRDAPPALVLFDLDETLFDDAYARRRGLARVRALDPATRQHPVEWLWELYGRLLNASHRREVDLGIDAQTARRERFRQLGKAVGADWSDARVQRLVEEYRAAYMRNTRAVPGSARLLDRIRTRAQVGIVTNNRVAEQESKLDAIGLAHRVDFMVASEGVGVWKPDPAIFRLALKRAQVEAGDAVMIGDVWEDDVRGAFAAGIRPVWFDRYQRPRPARPPSVEVVRSFVPLEPALRALGFAPTR